MIVFQSSIFFIMFFTMLPLSLFFYYNNTMMLTIFPIMYLSSMEFQMSFILDWMSLMFASIVSVISASIMIFSSSYIHHNEHKRFFIILLSFILSMMILIFSNNIFFMMLGWDGLGFSSYILVIYYQNSKSSESGALTILSNRIGDIAILLAISSMTLLGSWDFFMTSYFPLLTLMLLITAAMTKSAQMPFMAWLPAAMAAPTPISALVHSSTLVTAGVYLMIRIMNINHPWSLNLILILSSMTLLLSGLSANWEQDMKKIIALSTLSQIAIMMFAIAINSSSAAFFHLITHALFKSTMFLCAGAMIHGTSYQDTRAHGASSNNSPILMSSLGITSMALMGIPFMSGFFSKDLIIESLYSNSISFPSMTIIIMAIGLTASYSTRMIMFSSSPMMKMQKDNTFNLDIYMHTCLIFMIPSSTFIGSFLLWTTMDPQILMLTMMMKMSTLILILLGMLLGATLSFKNSFFVKTGEPSIYLWFFHTLSCYIPLKSLNTSHNTMLMDKTWLEMASAQGVYKLIKSMNYFHSSKFMFMISLSFIMLLPLIYLSL